jgi:two-component system, NarL family, nitrate/nitrite response regulator NarL
MQQAESSPEGLHVLVVSTLRLFRESIELILKPLGQFRVMSAGADPNQLAESLRASRADVVVIDALMPTSLATIRALRKNPKPYRIVAVGVADTESDVLAYAEAGVTGYVMRDDSAEDLVLSIQRAAQGETHCSPRGVAVLLNRVAALGSERRARGASLLTSRELEVLGLVHQGLANKEIAQQLRIEVATVKNHMHNILEKLQVRRRAQAAALFGQRDN